MGFPEEGMEAGTLSWQMPELEIGTSRALSTCRWSPETTMETQSFGSLGLLGILKAGPRRQCRRRECSRAFEPGELM